MLVRVDEALLKAREASVRTDQAIDRAQDAIDRFWEQQEAALARMRGEEKKRAEEKKADNAPCKCSCKDSGNRQEMDFCRTHALKSRAGAPGMTGQIDPELLMELVADLILLAGRMDEQIRAIEKRTRRQQRRRRTAGRFVPPPVF